MVLRSFDVDWIVALRGSYAGDSAGGRDYQTILAPGDFDISGFERATCALGERGRPGVYDDTGAVRLDSAS